MIALKFQPLQSLESILLPIGEPLVIQSDYLHTRRALVEACAERGWAIHYKSKALARCVSTEDSQPCEVVRTAKSLLMAVWVGGVA
jgi:hypothetical protein